MKRIVLLLLTLSLTIFAGGQDIKEHTERKKRIEEEISNIDKQLNANIDKKRESIRTLALTREKIESRKRLISQIDTEIQGYDRAILQKEREISRLKARLDTLKEYHSNLVLNSYKMRDSKIWFIYILAGEDLEQSLRRWSYLKNISRSVKEQATEIKETQTALEIEKRKLNTLRNNSMKAKEEREKEYDRLSAEEKKANSLISKLSKNERKMRKELEKKRKEVERLNKEIERIVAAAVRKEKEQGKKDGKPATDYKLSAKFGENRGKLPWPVEKGVIIERFGQNYHPVFKNLRMPFNNGINISSPKGSTAHSVFDGVVKQILVMPGYNQCVLVQHGEYFTFYCKLKMVYVKSGDKIKRGDKIGEIDLNDTGNAELHFQLWKGTEKQNPEKWLRK